MHTRRVVLRLFFVVEFDVGRKESTAKAHDREKYCRAGLGAHVMAHVCAAYFSLAAVACLAAYASATTAELNSTAATVRGCYDCTMPPGRVGGVAGSAVAAGAC